MGRTHVEDEWKMLPAKRNAVHPAAADRDVDDA